MISRFKDWYQQNRRWIPIAGFVLGFLFDAVMLKRIDELSVLIQQALYLAASAALIAVEFREHVAEIAPPRLLRKLWPYREFLLHFLLGTLLNSYTIFYFKSASALTSFLFIFLLVGLLTANEFLRFGKSQTQVHLALWSLCVVSYFGSLSPILLGFTGTLPFLLGGFLSVLVYLLYLRMVQPRLGLDSKHFRSHLIYPYAGVHALWIALYLVHTIPPVPLSVSYMGIYHRIEKRDGEYALGYTRPWWKFWQHGDESFVANPGDVVYCFAQIFSPTRFRDQLRMHWMLWNERTGWQTQDEIPLEIIGGRDAGYRAYTQKTHYQPGRWRVAIETMDGREVGRLTFEIDAAESGTDSDTEKPMRFDLR